MELIKVTINLLGQLDFVAVLLAAIASFVLGFLWYGPVFGKKWMKYIGMTAESMKHTSKNKMTLAYLVTFATAFVEAMFLLFFTLLLQTQFWHTGLMIWFGFILLSGTGIIFWENKTWKLFVLNTGYRLVNILVIALVLSFFF